MKKRILSFLCAAVLLVTLLPVPALAANNAAGFKDTDSHWAKVYIQEAVQSQILRGVSETSFAPDTGMTRAMFVTAISRLAQQNGAKTAARSKTGFTDVPQDAWYASHLCWAVENGIITGVSRTKFDPDGLVTREQMCAIMERLLALLGKTPKESTRSARTFTDRAAISDFAEDAVSLMAQLDIIAGYPDGSFAPKSPVTRAEAAKVLCALNAYLEQTEKNVQSGLISGRGSHHSGSSGDSGNSGSGGSGETKDTYTVTFLTNAGDDTVSNMPSAQRVTSGGHVSPPSLTPAREGYLFIAWLDAEEQLFDFTSAITANTELHAAWKKDMSDPNGSEDPAGDTPISYLYEQAPEAYRLDDGSYTIYYPNLLDVFMLGEFTSEKAQAIADAAGGTIAGQLTGAVPFLQLLVPARNAAEIEALAEKLMERSDVAYASCDIPMIMDTNAADNNPWPGENGKAEADRGNEDNPNGNDWWAEAIHAYTAWENYTKYASPVKVGVIDNGFDTEHKDIKDAYSFLPQYPNTSKDKNLHGTHVSGIIAARNNDICIRGVADFIQDGDLICMNQNFDKDGNRANTITSGECLDVIERMLATGVRVINCSFGVITKTESTYLKEEDKADAVENRDDANNEFIALLPLLALKEKRSYDEYLLLLDELANRTATFAANMICSLLDNGRESFLIVQSAGNGYDNVYETGIDAVRNGYFASITSDVASRVLRKYSSLTYGDILQHTMIVAGVDKRNILGNYYLSRGSNYGTHVTICAPGSNIRSLNNDGPHSHCNTMSGTSMSAPMVTGAAALVWGIDPTLTAGEVRSLLINQTNTNVRAARSNDDDSLTYPMLDVGMAAKAAYEGRPAHPRPAEDTGNVTLSFYDSKTNEPISIDTLFVDGSFLALANDALPDDAFGGFFSEAGEDGCFSVSTDYMSLEFTNIPAMSGYKVIFDAMAVSYKLPYESTQTYTVRKGETTNIRMALEPIHLIVGDVEVTTKNAANIFGDKSASYSYKTGQLTLKNAEIRANTPVYADMSLEIYLPAGTESTLTVTSNNNVIEAPVVSLAGENSKILPHASLFIRANDTANPDYAVHSEFFMNVNGINLDISAGKHALYNDQYSITLTDCNISCYVNEGKAIWAGGTYAMIILEAVDITIESSLTNQTTDPMLLGSTSGFQWSGTHMVQTEKNGTPREFSSDSCIINDYTNSCTYIGNPDGTPTTYLHLYYVPESGT